LTAWNKELLKQVLRGREYTPQEQCHKMIEVILHEQVHVLLQTYRCRGYCAGTAAQRLLCDYLSWHELASNKDPHHGPAFIHIDQNLKKVATEILRIPIPYTMILGFPVPQQLLEFRFRDVGSTALVRALSSWLYSNSVVSRSRMSPTLDFFFILLLISVLSIGLILEHR
jgi:hypothetical protein